MWLNALSSLGLTSQHRATVLTDTPSILLAPALNKSIFNSCALTAKCAYLPFFLFLPLNEFPRNKTHPQTHSWLQCFIHDWDTCALEVFFG